MRFRNTVWIAMSLIFPAISTQVFSAQPNIIIISVDTLRADHLSCYGYSRKTSPNIDGLVARGMLFTRASTNVPLTGPAFCSLFTSKYPHQTGATRNGIPMVEKNETLAQILKKHGYITAAILSNWPLKAHLSGLKPGFDLYDDDFFKKRWIFMNDERDAVGVTDNAVDWLESGPSQPFLLWAHYSEPHAPYVSHRGFDFSKPGPRTEEQMRIDSYDSEIGFADREIGRLMDKIDSMGLARTSLIIFVADHGESLGEHDYVGHGRRLYEPSMNIPFALVGPGIPAGVREDALVDIMDLAPTALVYAGINPGGEMNGMNLMPFVYNQEPWPKRTICMETYSGALRMEELKDVFDTETPLWIGLRRDNTKVLYSLKFSNWERYDVGVDNGEIHNTAQVTDAEFLSQSDELMAWYNHWEDEGMAKGRRDAMSEEDIKQLESLGYIDK